MTQSAHASDDGRSIAFGIADTGIGISHEDQRRLFQAFTQVGDAHMHTRAEGTGLGLHLSAKLAELMQGRIEVDSTPGQGSRFTLVLAKEQ